MAHVEKYSMSAVGHMLKHYERAKENGEYVRFGNQNIDLSLTDRNYNMAAGQTLPQLEFLHQRLSEVKVQKRKDVNVMCSWIVTLPKGEEAHEQQFFQETFAFLADRYGMENVVSAYVHKDESQPHLHFSFVPVVPDKKKNRYKVSAKELLTRQELQRFHEDLERHLFNVFRRDMGVRNEATKYGNKSVRELKRQTALKEQMKLENQVADLEYIRENYNRDIEQLQKDSDILHLMLEKNPNLRTEYRAAKNEIENESESGSEM